MRRALMASRGGLLAAWVLFAPPALAITLDKGPPPVTMDVTETFLADWHASLDDADLKEKAENIVDLRNRLNIRMRRENLTFGARLDTALFTNPPSTEYENDVRLEELFLTARLRKWRLTAGDDYVSLGRGMALSLRKVDDLGFDLSLRGAHAIWNSKSWSARMHAGLTNVVNVDSIDEKLVPDPLDLVLGLRVEAKPTRKFTLGAHVVDVERRHSDALGSLSSLVPGGIDQDPIGGERFLRSWIAGGNVEIKRLWKKLSFYGEANVLSNASERSTKDGYTSIESDGLAVYGAATYFAESTTVMLEGKHYDSFSLFSTVHPDTASREAITREFTYIAPPTLERVDQRVLNNTNTTGAHVQVDQRLANKLGRVFVSGAAFVDAPADDEYTLHAYAGWETRKASGDRYIIQSGFRREWAPDLDRTRLEMIHVDLDAYVGIGGGRDLQIHLNHEFRSKNPDADAGATGSDLSEDYMEGTAYLTLTVAPHWSLTAQGEYITNAATKEKGDAFLGVPATFYPGTQIQYRFTQSTYVRLFVGRSKGGLKCAGGICRVFPEAEGAKLEATLRF